MEGRCGDVASVGDNPNREYDIDIMYPSIVVMFGMLVSRAVFVVPNCTVVVDRASTSRV
jgi:hypothetical protein